MTDLKEEVSGIMLDQAWAKVAELQKEIKYLRGALEFIAEPSQFPLPAEAHALKSIAGAALNGRQV